MSKRIACLHAHYSNITYIEDAFLEYEIEWLHFVDPGLMYMLNNHEVREISLRHKTSEYFNWIIACKVDAIVVTCTQYILLIEQFQLSYDVPIIKIDEPFFEQVLANEESNILLFTNPATVEGTMNRLALLAEKTSKPIQAKSQLIEDSFELIMKGENEQYNQKIIKAISELHQAQIGQIAVAQLSMTAAAEQALQHFSISIINPLQALVDSLIDKCSLKKRMT